MWTTFVPDRDQPRSLKRILHPCIAVMDSMLFAQLLVKVTHIKIRILLPIQFQDLFQFLHWHLLRTGPFPSVVVQTIESHFLPLSPPASDGPRADTQYLRCLPPRDLLCHCPHDHFLYFHRSLHGSFPIQPLHHLTSRWLQSFGSAAVKSGQLTC